MRNMRSSTGKGVLTDVDENGGRCGKPGFTMDKANEKYEKLLSILSGYERAAVAFSGGVDSTFLLKAAKEALGDRVMAVTARLLSFPEREFEEAEDFCRKEGIRRLVCDVDQLAIPGFAANPPDRCYICKKALFTKMLDAAAKEGFPVIAEGSNADDTGDYRPGMKALRELGVKSPLMEAELTKEEIRALSAKLSLPTWDKPSLACLATRFVYGETLTKEALAMAGGAEQLLFDMGFRQVRVRVHGGNTARIEVLPEELPRLFEQRDEIVSGLRGCGFLYVAADLSGYRTGSMNAVLDLPQNNDK